MIARKIVYLGFSLVANQSFFTGGGTGVVTVAMDTSPMIRRASLQAWYMRSISSRFCASSGDSSIMDDWKVNYFY